MYRSILLPTDGSEAAERGVREGLRLAQALKAKVAFLYALEPLGPRLLLGPETLPYYQELVEDLRKEGLAALDRATRMAEELGLPFEAHLLEGLAAEVILKEAEKHDLVVLGTHGRTGLDRLLLGSVARDVARRSPKPVLLVPHRRA
ncbi:Nucleotide-binding universal stress protein, UspA family [Thermus arciformis]|uniref:Nucleotide-binding universal stress protein, UspA family n=1 Tax=Thermus arciformis TaxID=482827 RepID=A0A1G7LK18_9DEIN|nr:universal stress protein [Thermus arciformis]SDF49704.1 Nucleotide-binding universal stress protein, UspA family [Thermus arciformis]